MGKRGKFEYKEFKEFDKKIKKLSEEQIDLFMNACAKELAARLLAKVIKRTPVGQYPPGSGKVGGTLRRGWTSGKSASSYAESLNVKHTGNEYVIEITNPIEYASYVEYGHRTRNHKGWVTGKFMLTVSEQELQTATPAILERKINNFMGECFK